MKEKEETKVNVVGPQLLVDHNSTSMTDIVSASHRSDGSVLLRFISDVHEYQVENHRTVIPKKTVNKLIDILCKATGYYPEQPKDTKPVKKKVVAKGKTAKKLSK